jgi:hypothetical protein
MPFSFRLFGLAALPAKLPPDALRALMLHARSVDRESAEFGNTLPAEAGEYLSAHSLRSLIRDEYTCDVAKAEIRENKKLFERLAVLLPAISELFDPEDPDNITGFTSAVWNCCEEYRASLSSERKDKKERQALKRMADASQNELTAEPAIIRGAGHRVPNTGAPFNERLEAFLKSA